jgi:hypothetical protein
MKPYGTALSKRMPATSRFLESKGVPEDLIKIADAGRNRLATD